MKMQRQMADQTTAEPKDRNIPTVIHHFAGGMQQHHVEVASKNSSADARNVSHPADYLFEKRFTFPVPAPRFRNDVTPLGAQGRSQHRENLRKWSPNIGVAR
jgi:hypothetical protein